MEMTNEEIIRSFKESRDKRKQVGVLADLNNCDKVVIKGILGEYIEQVKPVKDYVRHPKRVSHFNSTVAYELYHSGLTDTEIGDKMSTTRHNICIWRNSNELPNINKPDRRALKFGAVQTGKPKAKKEK